MYLYSRSATIQRDRSLDAIAFAVDVAGLVSKITGLEVHTWSVLYGAPITTVTWTTMVESHAAMGAAGDALQADAAYGAKVAGAAELFATAPEDSLVEVIATINDTVTLGNYASVVTAQCAPGKIAEAAAWGVDIFEHVSKLTGRPGIFGRSMYGPWASLGWITIADSLDQVDAGEAATNSDPAYVEMVDKGGSLFLPGSASSVLSQRIA